MEGIKCKECRIGLVSLLLAVVLSVQPVSAQNTVLKNNLLYDATGTFNLGVETKLSTSNLRTSTALTDWNYNAANWGYYYSHTLYEAPRNDGEVNIYFDDVRQMRGTQASTVGLFLKIKNFGDVKEVVYSN